MTVHMDLLNTPDGIIVKAPGFSSWSYKPADSSVPVEEIKAAAEKSLRRHIGRTLRVVWWGFEG